MNIQFSASTTRTGYDRALVKEVYRLKQENNVSVITTNLSNTRYEEKITQTEDAIILTMPSCTYGSYFKDLAADYRYGRITDEELFSHLEDLYHGQGSSVNREWDESTHSWRESMDGDWKQSRFESVIQGFTEAIKMYYMHLNSQEWKMQRDSSGKTPNFYYNTDFHYMHQEEKEKFLVGANELAAKLGLKNVGDNLNQYGATINDMMAIMCSGNTGKFASLDVIPPPGMKIAFSVGDMNGMVSIKCGGVEYKAGYTEGYDGTFFSTLPFSYDTLSYKFALAEIFADFDIPDKYRAFINNITVINFDIARFNRTYYEEANRGEYGITPRVQNALSQYEKLAVYL